MKRTFLMLALAASVTFATAQDKKDQKKDCCKSTEVKACCKKPEGKSCCMPGSKAKAAAIAKPAPKKA